MPMTYISRRVARGVPAPQKPCMGGDPVFRVPVFRVPAAPVGNTACVPACSAGRISKRAMEIPTADTNSDTTAGTCTGVPTTTTTGTNPAVLVHDSSPYASPRRPKHELWWFGHTCHHHRSPRVRRLVSIRSRDTEPRSTGGLEIANNKR